MRKVLLLVWLCSGSLLADGNFTLDECLQAIRQSRETKIRSAIMNIRIENKYNDPLVPIDSPNMMKCYLDGSKMRRDSFAHGSTQTTSSAILGENTMILRVPTSERHQDTVSVLVDKNDREKKNMKFLNT
jgi:hypothetical protein